MKQPPPPPPTPLIIPEVEAPIQQQAQKRTRSSRAKSTPPAPKKKRATRAKKLYCTCQQPYNGEPMVQCDACEEWFHCTCVQFNPDNQEEDVDNVDWVCNSCKQGGNEPKVKPAAKEEKPANTRQTRTRSQSKCLYSGCNNRTRKDSFCSDVCARKQNEMEAPAPRASRRISSMRTSAQSMTPSTNKKNDDKAEQKEQALGAHQQQSEEENHDSDVEEKDDEFQAEEGEDDEDEQEEAPQSATPDTPMSPSQMTEEENPVRRNVIKNMKTVLKSIFDAALTENTDMLDESTLTTDERAEALAKSIENTMLDQLGDGNVGKKHRTCGEPYKSKFRSLLYNLKDKANKVFQIRVVTGDLTPDELIKMSSEDMANPELKSMSEVFRKTGLKNSVMKIDNTPIIKKTHKGDIIMIPDKDNNNMYSEQVQQELDKINNKPRSPLLSLSSPTASELKPIPSYSPTSSNSSHPVDPLDDILARIGIPAQDDNSHIPNKRSGSMFDTTSDAIDPEMKKRRVTLDVEELLGDEDETFQVEEVDTTELENEQQQAEKKEDKNEDAQEQNEEEAELLPAIWQGRVNMPQVAEFEASARQIGGRILSDTEWDQVLSPTMWVEGRIPSDRVVNYVTQTQYSVSREIILLEVEAKGGDGNEQAQTLLNYLDSRQRYAVVGHNKTRIKDFYLIPLFKAQNIPDCLYVVRVEETKRQSDMFLGVLVLTKQVQKPIIEKQHHHQVPTPYSNEPLHQQPPYQQNYEPHSPSSYPPGYGYNNSSNMSQSSNNQRHDNYSSSSYHRPY
ncbi:transcription factor S-II, central domain-containing protein [Parasitella parasitica]|nr:transcription factor S-II, central domain-containing protein [Parasitella parasitica]